MTSSAVDAPARSGPRLVLWGVAGVVLGMAVLALFLAWRSWQERNELDSILTAAGQEPFDAIEPRLRQAYQRHVEVVPVVRFLALGYFKARRFEETELFLNRWSDLSPRDPEPIRERINLWKAQQKTAQAVPDAERLLQLQPDDLITRQFLAQAALF